jgi:hypothetical protein
MPMVLRAHEARFERDGVSYTPPLSLSLHERGRASLAFAAERSASAAARLLAGLLKATCGWVRIGDYDPALQPARAKALVTFVSPALPAPAHAAFDRELRFRAALWGVDIGQARKRAAAAGELFGLDDAYARSLALAMIRDAPLIVLDRPPAGTPELVAALAPGAGIVDLRVAAGAELPLAPRVTS